ncbi:MAG: radical SAM protein [Euryarchaeota archaeon]|nr:radical SAM protein [Euryarchaeota archaeon]
MPLETLGTNFWNGPLPLGCQLCREGAKMVVYVSGLCDSHCFYCPVGRDRMYTDVTFANERKLHADDVQALVAEARSMNARGVGITGGDPMKVPERVAHYCRALKAAFGPGFHIHMYTQAVADPAWYPKLADAGLDEIRFHPPNGWWDKMEKSPYDALFKAALATKMRVGCEVPAIPGKEEGLLALASYLSSRGVAFLNLNELEFSEANMDQLTARGFELLNDQSNVCRGSRDTAWNVVRRALTDRLKTTVHFCASTYKDSVQLRKRLQRMAQTQERAFEVASDDGTLLFGVVDAPAAGLDARFDALVAEHGVPLHLLQINRAASRIEIAPWILEDLHAHLPAGTCAIVEVYPTATRLEVERTPLPYPTGAWDDDRESVGPAREKGEIRREA